jgi:hypothetical protein
MFRQNRQRPGGAEACPGARFAIQLRIEELRKKRRGRRRDEKKKRKRRREEGR